MKKITLALFVLICAAHLAALVMDAAFLSKLLKPLIISSLFIYYHVSVNPSQRSRWISGALIFSFGGDVFLMFDGEGYFMMGLASFLLAHIFYIVAYGRHQNDNDVALTRLQRIVYPLLILAAGLVLVTTLYPNLGQLKMPVIVYALVIVTMVLTALFRKGRTTTVSFWMVFSGAVLFMTSDSILAINKFATPVPFSSICIMLTYMAAQFLIVDGLMKHGDYTNV